jgi:hypothetical protein
VLTHERADLNFPREGAFCSVFYLLETSKEVAKVEARRGRLLDQRVEHDEYQVEIRALVQGLEQKKKDEDEVV